MKTTKSLIILSLLSTLSSATLYEDAASGTTDKWKIYDNIPAGAVIDNINDNSLNSKVIKFTGEGRKNSYILGSNSGVKAWNNSTEKNISWKMNFAENFKIMVYVKTSLGQRVLYYDYKNKDRGIYKKKYIRFGLGRASKKGTWLTIQRDLESDLKKYEPNNSILSVNAFRVNGSGMIDDITLSQTKGTTTTTQTTPPTGALQVSNIESKRLSNTMAQISWNLNHKGTGQVEYGTTTAYGSFSKKDNSFNYDVHSQKLKHLQPNTTYHYRVISADTNGKKVVSNDATFSTKVGAVQTKPKTKPKTTNINPPITLKKLKAMIKNNEDVTQVNTSEITDMSYLFEKNKNFNQDISGWDVSNVTNMAGMFQSARFFNQPIGNWDVSKVTKMNNMFWDTTKFNQPIANWNVSNVTNMSYMFAYTEDFNQPIGNWNVSNVTDMQNMFADTKSFNQTINQWNVSNVITMMGMFENTISFNQTLNNWNTSSIKNMENMFEKAIAFNQPIGNWNVSNVTHMNKMFYGASNFNQPLNNWDVSNVKNMYRMFYGASNFNQPLNNWDVSNVKNMVKMFFWAKHFNQDISHWNISNVTAMQNDLSIKKTGLLTYSGLSTINYDKLLIAWSQLPLKKEVTLNAENIKYTSKAAKARQTLIDKFNWTIKDNGQTTK